MREVHYFAARNASGFWPFRGEGERFAKLPYERRCGEPKSAAPVPNRRWSSLQVARAILRDALEEPALADAIAPQFCEAVIDGYRDCFLLTRQAVLNWVNDRVSFSLPPHEPENSNAATTQA